MSSSTPTLTSSILTTPTLVTLVRSHSPSILPLTTKPTSSAGHVPSLTTPPLPSPKSTTFSFDSKEENDVSTTTLVSMDSNSPCLHPLNLDASSLSDSNDKHTSIFNCSSNLDSLHLDTSSTDKEIEQLRMENKELRWMLDHLLCEKNQNSLILKQHALIEQVQRLQLRIEELRQEKSQLEQAILNYPSPSSLPSNQLLSVSTPLNLTSNCSSSSSTCSTSSSTSSSPSSISTPSHSSLLFHSFSEDDSNSDVVTDLINLRPPSFLILEPQEESLFISTCPPLPPSSSSSSSASFFLDTSSLDFSLDEVFNEPYPLLLSEEEVPSWLTEDELNDPLS